MQKLERLGGAKKTVHCTYIMHNTSTLFLDPKRKYMERNQSRTGRKQYRYVFANRQQMIAVNRLIKKPVVRVHP